MTTTSKEQEKLLELEIKELEAYEDAFQRTQDLTDNMVSLLMSFEQRLSNIEPIISPIQKSTQKLIRIQENIDKALVQFNALSSYVDISVSKAEILDMVADPSKDYEKFYAVVKKMKDALMHLQTNQFGNAAKTMNEMKAHLDLCYNALVQQLKKSLDEISILVDVLQYDTADIPIPSNIIVQNINQIIGELNGIAESKDPQKTGLQQHHKQYSDTRSEFLVKSLQSLANSVNMFIQSLGPANVNSGEGNESMDVAGNLLAVLNVSKSNQQSTGPITIYVKKSCPFLVFIRIFLKLIRAEKDLVQRCFPKKQAILVFQNSTAATLTSFAEASEAFSNKIKKNVLLKRDFAADSLYILLDIIECIQPLLKEYDGALAYAGLQGSVVTDLFTSCRSMSVSFLKEHYDDLNSERQGLMPVDGTVHELSSSTLNLIKNVFEYQQIFDSILVDAALPFQDCVSWATLIVDALIKNFEFKSQSYVKQNKQLLSTIFLLNNYYYIQKNLGLIQKLQKTGLVEKCLKIVQKHRDSYTNNWQPLCAFLMDQTIVQNGAIQKTLTKQQREDVKDKFKNFNSAFDERYEAQKSWAVPDPELRLTVIKDVKKALLPMYTRFYDKYTEIEFSKTPQKYIKYDKKDLEDLIDKFFDASA